ncbi:VP1 [Gokushovirus WZ-2015a]|nr:VP1 [Gokushovirus WZ-2015a]
MAYQMKMPSSVVNNSNILPQATVNLSTFDLSETLVTGIGTDNLYPVYWRELQPNDHFEIKVSALSRIMPMVAPPMTNIKLKFFAFWVPNRTIWSHWMNFMGEETYQGDKVDVRVPQIKMKSAANVTNGIADYLGIPPTVDSIDYTVSALPFRAYNKIWNEWFRANYIQDVVQEFSGDTSDEETLDKYKLLKKGKPIDYFTSCLPQPEQVDISLLGNAPVKTTTLPVKLNYQASGLNYRGTPYTDGGSDLQISNDGGSFWGTDTNMFADMSAVSGLSIESLRKASSIQVLLEKDRRSGLRYIDLIKEHFGMEIPDFLVGRSEYVGSVTIPINSEPIVQQSESASTPQGNLASLGFGVGVDKLCEFSAREHGHLMILACVESEVIYQQGLDRKWEKRDRFDYYFPEFANLGEQPVMERELMLTASNATTDKVFGYTPRYREEREGYNKISGIMRSNVTSGFQSLDVWHLAQKFAAPPQLNGEFIESNSPLERVLAVSEDIFVLLNIAWDIKATRSIPIQSNPSLVTGKL